MKEKSVTKKREAQSRGEKNFKSVKKTGERMVPEKKSRGKNFEKSRKKNL